MRLMFSPWSDLSLLREVPGGAVFEEFAMGRSAVSLFHMTLARLARLSRQGCANAEDCLPECDLRVRTLIYSSTSTF